MSKLLSRSNRIQNLFEALEIRSLMSAVAPMATVVPTPSQGNVAIVATGNNTDPAPTTPANVQVRNIGGVIEVMAQNNPYSSNPAPANLSVNVWHNYNRGVAEYTISSDGQSVTLAGSGEALHVQDNTQGSTFSFSAFDTALTQDNVGWITIENRGGTIVSQSVVSLTGFASHAFVYAPGMYSASQTFIVSQSADDYAGGNTLIAEGNGQITLANHSQWADTFYGQAATQAIIDSSSNNTVNMWTESGGGFNFVGIGGGSNNTVNVSGGGTSFINNSSGGWVTINNSGNPKVYAFNMWGGMTMNVPLAHNHVTFVSNTNMAFLNVQGYDDGHSTFGDDLSSNVLVYFYDINGNTGGKG